MNITEAGTKVTVRIQAIITPLATKAPNTCTGGMGVRARLAKPAAEVSEV